MTTPSVADLLNVDVLVIGAGPAGLAAAITAKTRRPESSVCVIDKAAAPGSHNLSGAILETAVLGELLDDALSDWRKDPDAREVLSTPLVRDDILFFNRFLPTIPLTPFMKIAGWLHLPFGQFINRPQCIISVSRLTQWLCRVAVSLGVEVLHGFAAESILFDSASSLATGVKLTDQGLDAHCKLQPNFLPGATITADAIVLAEGVDGTVTESFISTAGLQRQRLPLYSVSVKERIAVSAAQYASFGRGRTVHAMGYPLWRPLLGPGMFGGGALYDAGENHLNAAMIVGADWVHHDFNPLDALERFKQHRYVRRFIHDGTVVGAGAKLIPEGGWFSVPRDPASNAMGRSNVMIVGDAAGLVNMFQIKGLHYAIMSGLCAGTAIADSHHTPASMAGAYTAAVESSFIARDLKRAAAFRQRIARFGNAVGFPLGLLSPLGPCPHCRPDHTSLRVKPYHWSMARPVDKDAFVARAQVMHREDQPCHCHVLDAAVCRDRCVGTFNRPCVTFCPGGVYERRGDTMVPVNPSNCLHCKTCQNKCPFDNLRWTCPEPTGGPHYSDM